MATEIPIKIQIVKSLSTANPSRIVAVKADGDDAFSLFVTDKTGIPYPLKGLQDNVIITNTDGNLQITSSSTSTNINLASSILVTINSALQNGDNISELINDVGYLTSFTETDPIFQASEASLFVSGDKANLDNQSGINSGNQTSIVGISGTKAEFNTELTDGNFLFVGDVVGYTNEEAQDAVGTILTDTTTIDFTYDDTTPTISANVKLNSIDATHLADNINISEFVNDEGYINLAEVPAFNPLNYDLDDFTNVSVDPFARTSELTSGITNLSYTPSATNGIVVSDTGTDATIPTVDFTNAGLLTPSEKQLLYNNSATGITKFDGFSINVDTTKYNTGIIEGWFVDNTTNPNAPTKVFKSFPATTANTLTNIATQNVTYIAVDINGVHQQSGVPFEPEVQRDWIPLGVLVHSNRVSINAINNQPVVAINPNNQLSDLMESIGVFNISGNVFSPNGVNLSINKSAGQIFKQGSNFITNTKDPHTTLLPALIAPSNIRYRTQLGAESANTNVIAPNFWDNAGVITAMTGTRWSIQRIYVFQSNLIRIQYGQATYANLADAIQAIPTELFVVEQNILENGLFRGLLIVRNTTVDLTNPARALFIEASKFGSVAGLGSLSTTNLQQAYNNSLTPEIVTDSILEAFTLKRGSTLDTDNVFEVQNGAGTPTSTITGNGDVTANTFVKSGGLSTQFLKANGSVDATVYQSLLTNPVTGTGTSGVVPVFTGTSTLGNSIIQTDGNSVGIGIAPLSYSKLAIDGGTGGFAFGLDVTSPSNGSLFRDTVGYLQLASSQLKYVGEGGYNISTQGTTVPILFSQNAVEKARISTGGRFVVGGGADNGIDGAQFGTSTVSGGNATLANQFVTKSQLDLKADLASPTFTGVPTAPTATAGTNTTQIASTAFVQGAFISLTGNQTFNGYKTSVSSDALPSGFNLTNSNTTTGSAFSVYVNSATASNNGSSAIRTTNSNIGSNTSAIQILNDSSGIGLFSKNLSTGVGNYYENFNTGTLSQYNSLTGSNGDIIQFLKQGILTAKVNQNGEFTVPKITMTGTIGLKSYTVATLPASPTQGESCAVTDALAPAYLGIIVGGGAIYTPVVWNGSNWVAH